MASPACRSHHDNAQATATAKALWRVARRSIREGRYQVTDEQFRVESVDRALEYLKSKDALDKLSKPVEMLWGYAIMIDSLEQDK
jgi:hypothetical protein